MGKRLYTDEQFIEAVKNNKNLKDVLRFLGRTPLGANYHTAKKHIKRLNLNTSHFESKTEQANRTRKSTKLMKRNEIFSTNKISRNHIRKLIILDNLIPYECSICHIRQWQGQQLSLQLDHINGINNDHHLENLRFLCPNCHSLTPTYCGRNRKGLSCSEFCTIDTEIKKSNIIHENKCIDCNIPITGYSVRCKSCNKLLQDNHIIWPDNESLLKLINELGYKLTAKQLNISPSAIRKRLRTRGLPNKISEISKELD